MIEYILSYFRRPSRKQVVAMSQSTVLREAYDSPVTKEDQDG